MLSSWFNPETQGQKEFRRLIEREKNMIPENKVLVFPQIFKIIEDTTPSESIFGQFLRDKIPYVQSRLNQLTEDAMVPTFEISLGDLHPDIQKWILGFPNDERNVDEIYETIAHDMISFAEQNGDAYPFDQENWSTPAEILKRERHNGYYIIQIAYLLSRTALMTNNIEWYQNKSIRADEGQIVLNFWRGINKATNYFPDAPPPMGNDPDDGAGKTKVTDWVPGDWGQKPTMA